MVAKRVKIADVVNGKYFKKEGFEPNYVITPYGLKVSRLMFTATVVDIYKNDDKTYGALTFDDGTDTIRVKYFQDLEPMKSIEKGEIIEVIGKVKEYNEEIYIVGELLIKRGVEWELLHNIEYKNFRKTWQEFVEKIRKKISRDIPKEELFREFEGVLSKNEIEGIIQFFEIENDFKKSKKPKESLEITRGAEKDFEKSSEDISGERNLLEVIDRLDNGEGAEYSEIMKNSDLPEEKVDSIINNLLSDGTCYEPRPGKIKRL